MNKYIKYTITLSIMFLTVCIQTMRASAQLNSASVLVVPTPIIDSVSYDCIGATPIQVHVSNQISPCFYTVVNTTPVLTPVPGNSIGTFILNGATDATFRVNNGGCYTDIAIHFDCNGNPLPIDLIDFTARLHLKNKALLSWDVQDEVGVSKYEIQKSENGRDFTFLDAVVALNNGQSVNKYSLVDQQLAKGYNYYRIKIISQDGSVRFTPVRFVIYTYENNIVSYPNPANDFIYVEFFNESNADKIYLNVFNSISGLQQTTRELNLQSGFNKIAIDVRNLSDGMYHLVYSIGDKNSRTGTIKFQKISQ